MTERKPKAKTAVKRKKKPKLSKLDKQIVKVTAENPDTSIRQRALILKEKGKCGSEQSVYKRIRGNKLLQTQLAEIEKSHREFITRKLVPAAFDIHERVLKDKSIKDLKKKDFIKMAYDLEYKIDQTPVHSGNTINIKDLKIMIANDVQRKLK